MWSSEVWVALCYLQAYMWQEGCHAVPQVCSWRGTCACWVTTGVQEVLPIGVRLLVFQVPSVPQRVDLWWQTHASCFDHQLSRWPRKSQTKGGLLGLTMSAKQGFRQTCRLPKRKSNAWSCWRSCSLSVSSWQIWWPKSGQPPVSYLNG